MNKFAIAVTLLALAGCQTMREHPKATAFIATSIALSAGLAARNHRGDQSARELALSTSPCTVQPNGSCR